MATRGWAVSLGTVSSTQQLAKPTKKNAVDVSQSKDSSDRLPPARECQRHRHLAQYFKWIGR